MDELQTRSMGIPPGAYVRLTVSDTGMGMDATVHAHLFEPFFTTKGPGKGTGLGLATVYGIVTQSGGQITVKSAPGECTSFNIFLPVSHGNEEASGSGIYVPHADPPPRSGHETILLVEDQDDLREIARQIMQGSGYTVLDAATGVDGLAPFERNADSVHLVITDVIMPMMNGDELVQRLIQSYPHIRLIFIIGYADETLVSHNVFGTGIPLLQKPFTPNALLHLIREELDAPEPSHIQKP